MTSPLLGHIILFPKLLSLPESVTAGSKARMSQ